MKKLLALLLLIPSLSWGNPLYELLDKKYEIIDTHKVDNRVLYILYNKKEEHRLFHCVTWENGPIVWCKPVREVK